MLSEPKNRTPQLMPIAMPSSDTLLRLFQLLNSSLAMYIADSGIWSYPGNEAIKLAIADLVGDQKNSIERMAVILEERDLPLPGHSYPLRFASIHDLEMRSLLPRIIACLHRQLAAIDGLLATGCRDQAACQLAEEACSSMRRHSELLAQLLARLAAADQALPAAPLAQ